MNLCDHEVLVLDCQTTAVRPGPGRILEIAWSKTSAARKTECQVFSQLIHPGPEGIPERVAELTGVSNADLTAAVSEAAAVESLRQACAAFPDAPLTVIHYAQFEKGFLDDLFVRHTFTAPLDIWCSHRMARRLIPELPSPNIRALAGYFGWNRGEVQRSADHVRATIEVWCAVVSRLEIQGIRTVADAREWMRTKTPSAAAKFQYRVDRLRRLALPKGPGIYKMLAKDGRVLYVGKAVSLRSRVNSYFRGRKGRDRRKLEMLARVWNIGVTECGSALEAALLESDEIKRLDPPYNLSLRSENRAVIFYKRDFSSFSEHADTVYSVGPFRPRGPIESLRELLLWRQDGIRRDIFYQEIEPASMDEGFRLFCLSHGISTGFFEKSSLRELVGIGMRELRKFCQTHAEDPETIWAKEKAGREPEAAVTPEDIAGKLARLFMRSAFSLWRSRQMTRLLNADVVLKDRVLHIRRGRLSVATGPVAIGPPDGPLVAVALPSESLVTIDSPSEPLVAIDSPSEPLVGGPHPWSNAGIADYDRISILLSEIERKSHAVFRVTAGPV